MRALFLRSAFMLSTFGIGILAAFGFGILLTPNVEMPSLDLVPEVDDVAFLTGCEFRRPDAEASAVYAAVLSYSHNKNDNVLVITETTNRGGTFMDEQIDTGNVPGADQDTIASYKTNNLTPSSLREALSKLPKVILWTEQDDKTITRNDRYDMELFRKKHPKSRGLISLSNIGFNQKRDQALVYFSYYCGPLCAGGSFMILQKKGGRWRVTRENQLWVS